MMRTQHVLDFSSNEADLTSLLLRSAVMLVVWLVILSISKRSCTLMASALWSQPIPIHSAFIPSKLPHPNPPGGAIPFDLPLLEASESDVEKFMFFMFTENQGCVDVQLTNNDNPKDKKWTLQDVANYAAAYKGQLYEERTMKWIDDHFRLKLPNLKYPYVDRHWNGWSSFWLETGPRVRSMFLSSATVIVEHVINGLIFPILYLMTKDLLYYNIALYSEVAYMIWASFLIGLSYYYREDMTIEQMHPAVWSLLLLHHISSLILCIGCLLVGDNVPRNLVCYALLCLLGFTSSLHYVSQILDFSPVAHANAPYTRLLNHILCFLSQLVFRVIYWAKICYLSILHCFEVHGMGLASALIIILALFTTFNFDFLRFHFKATKGCWSKIREMKKD